MKIVSKYIICLSIFLLSSISFADEDNIMVEVLSKSAYSWDKRGLPAYKQGKPEVTILKISIPPGVTLPIHKHPVINAGVLISGELTVITDNGKRLHLKEGEAIIEVVDTWHYGKNEGIKQAVIIVFYAGVENQPISVYKKQAD